MVWPLATWGRCGRLVVFLHAFLNPLDRATEVLADVGQLLGAEDEDDDDENDQPVPDAETTMVLSP